MDYILLGQRIRAQRTKLNLTQEKLAEKADIAYSYLGQVERSERVLSVETLTKLANALGVTVDDLLHDSIHLESDQHVKRFAQLVNGRSERQKQMALEVVKAMLSLMDKDELKD